MIKVQHEGDEEPRLYTPSEFESVMGVKFCPCLIFAKDELRKAIEKQCHRANEENLIARKQKWLGVYYAKEISQGISPDLTIRWINPILRYGVFANQSFETGELVCEYTGILNKHFWFRRRERGDYLFYYYVKRHWNSPYYINAEYYGNHSRYINHSTKGNLEPVYVLSGGIIHILLVAKKKIPIGAQLCYDYGDIYWKKREKPLSIK